MISRSAAFKARYSAFRNMTFDFRGNYLGAAQAIYWLGLIPLLVVGTMFDWWGEWQAAAIAFSVFSLIFPWWLSRLKNYLISYASFGGLRGDYSATGGQFFRVYFVAALIVVAGGILSGVAGYWLLAPSPSSDWAVILMSVPAYLG